jgi:hypothetical protein
MKIKESRPAGLRLTGRVLLILGFLLFSCGDTTGDEPTSDAAPSVQAEAPKPATAAKPKPPPKRAAAEAPVQVLFTNVRVFDGTTDGLSATTKVLIEDNLIAEISPTASAGPDATVIDGGGRTLMPGLIDSHVHINMYKDGTLPTLEDTTWEEIGARAVAFAQEMLSMGFMVGPGALGAPVGGRRREGDGRRDPRSGLRALLHDEGTGNRPRTVDRVRHRRTERRPHRRGELTWSGDRLPRGLPGVADAIAGRQSGFDCQLTAT